MSVSSVAARRAQYVTSNDRPNLPEPYGKFYDSIMRASRKYNLPPEVLFGILKQESGGRVDITGYDGHGQGPWQIDDRWHGDFLRSHQNGRDIDSATDYAAHLLRQSIDALGGNLRNGIAAYNAGVGGVQSALNAGRSADSATTGGNYAATILANAADFKRYLGGHAGAPGTEVDTSSPSQPTSPSSPSSTTDSPSSSSRAGSSYQIQRGDTLWAIATRLKAQGVPGGVWDIINQIVAMNPQIKDPNLIYAGDTLKLPGSAGTTDSTFSPSANIPAPVDISSTSETDDVNRVDDRDANQKYKVAYINQYRPSGAENGYGNGPANCGPTSMAMIARAFGYGEGMSDAKLINHLGAIGGTTGNGTNVNGLVAMANAMGKQGTVRGPGANVDWIAEQLKAGKLVVANGDYYAMPPHENGYKTSGHYVTVTGMTPDGRFLINDPADQNVKSVSAAELAKFISSNPNGGYQISVG